MKKFLLSFILSGFFLISFGQPDDLRQELDFLMGNLNASDVPSGYLAPYGMDMADKEDLNGIITDSNVVNNLEIVRLLYADIYTSRFYSGAPTMPSIDALNSTVENAENNSLLLFYGQFSVFKEDALQQNLIQYNNGQLYDVQGRQQSPYILQNTFVAYPKQGHFTNGTVTLQFNPSLYYTNTSAVIQLLQADFGSGFQTINPSSSVTNIYTDSTGWHLITLKAQLSNGTTQYTRMAVWVQLPSDINNPMARYTPAELTQPDINIAAVPGVHSGCRVYIRRSVNTPAGQILKPLIVAEGFDIHDGAPHLDATNYNVNQLIAEWERVFFNGNDFNHSLDDIAHYDLVFIDWNNSTDHITNNAVLLEDVIGRINTIKASSGSTEQNVVMGISMGGLITRYCLASMTKRGVNPQTRLLITHDSPHKGAYVPLAFQHLVMGLHNKTVLGLRLSKVLDGSLNEAVALLQSPAAQQELMMVVTDENGTVVQNTFLPTTYRSMITFAPGDPQPQYQFIATAQGSQCGIGPLPIGATLINGSASGNFSGYGIHATLGIISKWKYASEVDAKGLTGNPSHQILHFKLERRQRLFFGLVNNNKTIVLLDRYEPSFNNIPWESVPASIESLGDRLETGNTLEGKWSLIGHWYIGLIYNFTLADRFGFLPVVSALDVNTVSPTTVFDTYLRGVAPPGGTTTNDFIAQEPSGSQFNLPHTAFTARNSEWLYTEMENLPFTDCANFCLSNNSIIGPSTTCSPTIYTINNLPNGATVTWSVSPQNLASVNPTTGNQTTLTGSGNGTVTLTASVLHCGNNITLTKQIFLSAPTIGGTYFFNGSEQPLHIYFGEPEDYNNACVSQTIRTNMQISGSTNVTWTKVHSYPSNISWSQNGSNVNFYFYGLNQTAIFRVTATNSCGTTTYDFGFKSVGCSGGGGCEFYSVSPNPATSSVNIMIPNIPPPCDGMSAAENSPRDITEVTVFDQSGMMKKKVKYAEKTKQVHITLEGLKPGVYIFEIGNKQYKERKQVIIMK